MTTISIPLWLLIFLVATNVIVWVVGLIILYIIFGILDFTYHQRHKSDKTNCPDKIEKEKEDD